MIKSGTPVYLGGLQYLFLGYTDYRRRYARIADRHGNTAEVAVSSLGWHIFNSTTKTNEHDAAR
jgi:hypothetical protein